MAETLKNIANGTTAAQTNDSKRPVVCVFCGSNSGNSPAYLESARALAQQLHAANARLVYGGGTVGLMGEVAKTLVALSGPDSVHGIIPNALIEYEQKRTTKPEIDESVYGRTTVVPDMHTRKRMMAKEVTEGGAGGGFVALSGGFGTMEELMEVTTWNQLGIHERPVVVYNVDGYYDGLLQWVGKAVSTGFIKDDCKGILVEAKTSEEVMQRLQNYKLASGRFGLNWEQQ